MKQCNHNKFNNGHCGEMVCYNYIFKCPVHGLYNDKDAECIWDAESKDA